jgi:hypothetical protein
VSTTASDRDELHNALDGLLRELGPGEKFSGLGISVACGTERLLYSWVPGAAKNRKDVLTDPDAVRNAFLAGTLNLTSEDVPT